jgi:glycosyltransferase involved in cell wall biosynthesis
MQTISVIIPTFNGANKIPALLDSLLKQTLSRFEVIVVVDGSTDNTMDVLSRYANKFDALRVISQDNSGRSNVRNRGAKEAVGDLLIFYDDDVIPMLNSVECHLKFHSSYDSAILAGNPIEYISSEKTDVSNYKAWLTKIWVRKYQPGITRLNFDNLFFTAANCSMPKRIFLTLNGFDERIKDAEDFDFATRALESGIEVYFDKQNEAVHNDAITCLSYIKRLRQYDRAHKQLSILHSNRKRVYSSQSSGLKRMVYRIFANMFWVRLIDRQFFVSLLPRWARYKFYSVVTHALSIEYPEAPLS